MKKTNNIEKVVAEMWKNHSANEISKVLGTTVSTVNRWGAKLKLPSKRKEIDFSGKIVGNVRVMHQISSKKSRKRYACQCNCGKIIELTICQLSENKTTSCRECYKKKYGSFIDFTGKRFGRLVAIRRVANQGKRTVWECKCDCGRIKPILSQCLTAHTTVSCGCLSREKARNNFENLIGKRFNRLVVISRIGRKWLCKCDCGNEIVSISTPLIDGRTKSCGCYALEIRSGENNHFWKGGVSSLNMETRKGSGSRKWAAAVKKRDEYKCVKCKFQGRPLDYKLVAHHVKSFHKNKQFRLDVDNGITFCKKCHVKFHKLYGYNASESDLKEFLKTNNHALPNP